MPDGGPYPIGKQFGPYILDAYLGAGAFKTVYRAHRNAAAGEETVALGFPHHQDAEGVAELEKELSVSSRLVHPNILRIYGIERYEGVSFLVMEYLEGETLRMKLRQGPLEPAAALRYVGLVAEALSHAHAAHVLHRDVKPENILVTTDGTPKLFDFGIARLLARTSAVASTRVGTIGYMAPEQFQGAAGTNADLWALGVTFFELLNGERPFAGETGVVIHKIMHDAVDASVLYGRQIDRRIVRVIVKMLAKDADDRYRTADELANELEAVARRSRMVEGDEGRLEVLVRASFPLLYVLSFEEERVLAAVRGIAERLGGERQLPRQVLVWSASRGLRDANDKLVSAQTGEDPTGALVHAIENPGDAIYVFLDVHRYFTPVTTRLVRDAARAVRTSRKSLIFVAPFFSVPPELEKEVTLHVFQLPEVKELGPVLDGAVQELQLGGLADEETRGMLLRSALGMTLGEAARAFRAAGLRDGGLRRESVRRVSEVKSQLIRKSGLLEYYDKPESDGDVGGLENLRDWFRRRAPVFARTARYAGLPVPKGVLLVGVPGCGKSLSARALAGTWGVPLLRLDVGRLFGSIVGSSEANLRQAIQVAEAVSPCILWIDEIEKGFAGSSGHNGGRVTVRVFGTFLNWLQEKQSPVFVVATANDISGLPPELLRKGRFDEIFFVGLPRLAERRAIFGLHLSKRHREPARFDLQALARQTEGYSGAEIEQVIVEGMFRAFDAERDVETGDLLNAAAQTYPLARTRDQEIAALTQWARVHARAASSRVADDLRP